MSTFGKSQEGRDLWVVKAALKGGEADFGEIIERGSHADLMAEQGRYFDLYTRQASYNFV